MSAKTKSDRLTSRERLARGLKYSTVGPVDVTRGAVGISAHTVGSSAAWLRDRYRNGQLRDGLATAQETIANELAAASEMVSNLPQALQDVRKGRRRPRPLVLAVAAVAVLALGAVTFSIIRRSTQPDPSPRPPSVEVSPKP